MGSIREALNLGCGNDYRESIEDIHWVNADSGKCKKDVHMNMEWHTWPFKDDTFDLIEAIQVLEHMHKYKFIDVIREMYRVTKDGGEWLIAVPHAFSDNFITDPTHRMPFSTRTMDYLVDGTPLRELGLIYGWANITLEHIEPPLVDGNQSIIFHIRVRKNGSEGNDRNDV